MDRAFVGLVIVAAITSGAASDCAHPPDLRAYDGIMDLGFIARPIACAS